MLERTRHARARNLIGCDCSYVSSVKQDVPSDGR